MRRFPTLRLPTFLTAVFLMLEVTPVHAQTTLTLTGGVNRTSLGTDADGASRAPGFESLPRMSIGLAATLPVSDCLGGSSLEDGTLRRVDAWTFPRVMAMMGNMFGGFEEMPPGASFDADYEIATKPGSISGRSMSASPRALESTSG